MDWLQVLFFLLLFVVPLLEQVLKKRNAPPTDPGDPEQLPPPAPAPVERRQGERREAEQRQLERREGDRRLPATAGERTPATMPMPAAEESPLERLSREEAVLEQVAAEEASWLERPEAERVDAPVISLELLEVDREAEHRRLHDRAIAEVPAPRPRRSGLAAMLHGSGDLRRAMVLQEVLGPPRSERQ